MEPNIHPEDNDWITFSLATLEWIAMALAGIVTAAGGWVWHLAARVERLSVKVQELKEDRAEDRQHIDQLETKIDSLRTELPSRNFIETQLRDQTARIDQLFSSRLDRSRHP